MGEILRLGRFLTEIIDFCGKFSFSYFLTPKKVV